MITINRTVNTYFHTFKTHSEKINVIDKALKHFNKEEVVYLYDNRYLVALTKEQYNYFSNPQRLGSVHQVGILKDTVDLLSNQKRLNLSCTLLGLELEEVHRNIKKDLEF